MARTVTATPNGFCWDDCGGKTKPGSFFLPGHDKRAERYLEAIEGSQSIAERLAGAGFVPGSGGSLRSATLSHDPGYEECGLLTLEGQECRVIGKGVGMRRHRANTDGHQIETD